VISLYLSRATIKTGVALCGSVPPSASTRIGQKIGQIPDVPPLPVCIFKALRELGIGKTEIMETVHRIEPARLEEPPEAIHDAVAELSAAAATLGQALHPRTAANLAALVRLMNAYYSNLIEGHNTRPRDIERALAGEFDGDPGRRNLQLEAAAHVRVQAQVDALAAENRLPEPASPEFLRWLHGEFYRDTPEELRRMSGAGRNLLMEPGVWRSRPEHEVEVGRHVPPSSARVPEFMDYFADRYAFARLGKAGRILAMASAHHRFNYIHPERTGEHGRASRRGRDHHEERQAGRTDGVAQPSCRPLPRDLPSGFQRFRDRCRRATLHDSRRDCPQSAGSRDRFQPDGRAHTAAIRRFVGLSQGDGTPSVSPPAIECRPCRPVIRF
jgi:hypothetical protein